MYAYKSYHRHKGRIFQIRTTSETAKQKTQRGSRVELPVAMPAMRSPNGECYSRFNVNEHGTINAAKGVKKGQLVGWRCAICSRSFSRQANLNRHQNTSLLYLSRIHLYQITNRVTDACPRCTECKEYFPSNEKLSEHRDRCHNLRPSKDATSKGLLKSTKQAPQVQITYQNALVIIIASAFYFIRGRAV